MAYCFFLVCEYDDCMRIYNPLYDEMTDVVLDANSFEWVDTNKEEFVAKKNGKKVLVELPMNWGEDRIPKVTEID